ncbi:hypothetical protein [Polyangium sp. 6x1]|uniref:hypothetical protein n=1 Tax=Polyangium sp. 6x1 TaxID=3042689 RepID=UPI002482FE25|nr:hypothetical protein [Polyangium sp. 6x1]MDI1450778.1 hypothetical protein [Polyangium sp. 6x1]
MKKRLFFQSLSVAMLAVATMASTAAQAAEVLAVDVSENVNRGLFGGRDNYSYPLGGRKVTRHEFTRNTRGHADVYVESIDSNQVKVHGWADAFSGYSFTLKVWVEE